MAIPGAEIDRKNPLESSATLLNEGRESFLAHCATCHGVDSSGKSVHLMSQRQEQGLGEGRDERVEKLFALAYYTLVISRCGLNQA